jgi:hypothetical protein
VDNRERETEARVNLNQFLGNPERQKVEEKRHESHCHRRTRSRLKLSFLNLNLKFGGVDSNQEEGESIQPVAICIQKRRRLTETMAHLYI